MIVHPKFKFAYLLYIGMSSRRKALIGTQIRTQIDEWGIPIDYLMLKDQKMLWKAVFKENGGFGKNLKPWLNAWIKKDAKIVQKYILRTKWVSKMPKKWVKNATTLIPIEKPDIKIFRIKKIK